MRLWVRWKMSMKKTLRWEILQVWHLRSLRRHKTWRNCEEISTNTRFRLNSFCKSFIRLSKTFTAHSCLGLLQSWLAEAGGRGDSIRYSTHSLNNNGAHNPSRSVLFQQTVYMIFWLWCVFRLSLYKEVSFFCFKDIRILHWSTVKILLKQMVKCY